MKMRALAIAGLIGLGIRPAFAGVTSVDFTSDTSLHHLTQFDGTATYDSAIGKLTVDVHNTTAASTGGFLTGIALDAGGPTAAYRATTGSGISDLRNHKGIVNAAPFGKYHAGAGTGGKWNSGSGASHGIAAGASNSFVFNISGANASSLSVADFLTPGDTGQEIVATFKKLAHHHSDRGGAVMSDAVTTVDSRSGGSSNTGTPAGQPVFDPVFTPPSNPGGGNIQTSAVPVPPAVWMALTTAALALGFRRKLQHALA
jgi:hypothetical protein